MRCGGRKVRPIITHSRRYFDSEELVTDQQGRFTIVARSYNSLVAVKGPEFLILKPGYGRAVWPEYETWSSEKKREQGGLHNILRRQGVVLEMPRLKTLCERRDFIVHVAELVNTRNSGQASAGIWTGGRRWSEGRPGSRGIPRMRAQRPLAALWAAVLGHSCQKPGFQAQQVPGHFLDRIQNPALSEVQRHRSRRYRVCRRAD